MGTTKAPLQHETVEPTFARGRSHHYPALDGLRGLALLSVFVAHFYTMLQPTSAFGWGGWLGVDVFFVLSGFLITGILFDSLGSPRYFRNFYIRRTLRIFPLYYSIWIAFLLLTPWLHPLWTRYDIARVFYYGNLMDLDTLRHPNILGGSFQFFTPSGHLTGFNTGHLWSLCLEEQFYLIWPLLLFLLKDRRRIMATCAAGIVVSLLLNCYLTTWAVHKGLPGIFIYDSTYTHVSPMFFGAWLALWLRGRPTARPVPPRVYLSLIAIPLIVLAISLHVTHAVKMGYEAYVVTSFGFTCSAIMGTGFVLGTIQQDGWLKRLLSARWLMFVGTISYGLYVIHGFLMSSFRHHLDWFQRHHVALLMPVAAFITTVVLALLSYYFLELPFLKLKDRWAPSRPVSITGRDPLAPARISDATS